ncbi:TRAP-type mannitol/chloroaromatic compound transport system permease small subunit [Labrenzia sp. EL_208]|uniref:TRAP transporter small permease subunit n=1 Tax=Roseibium album TaxID=311410 RepID=UPI001A35985D|nr:TRAP transporter small permease subunit [Roseibium album]MBG6177218.1 TRAP-type mannitol/chloroaromatic compound transport system permease small subunit [Labrenzia sp. EL_132]MBG6231839.1 TRAP-type mannitol/chloroaromatic compound transport system permease small subunit [Labrenzia sp. EL_208]MCR9059470.1 TRAP transporter small permease subunit [Paracoccaceae bacterium]
MRAVFSGVRRICMVLAVIVFLGQLSMVLMRYLLGYGFLEIQDAVNYAFAALVALSVAVTFSADKHVRVDIFRQKLGGNANRRIDWLGDLFLALPVFSIMMWMAYPLVRSSWVILEGSPETGGLPGLFLVKTCLLVLPTLIVLLTLVRVIGFFRRNAS